MPCNAAAPAPVIGPSTAVGSAAARARFVPIPPGWRCGLPGRRQMLAFSHRSHLIARRPSVGRVVSARFQPAADRPSGFWWRTLAPSTGHGRSIGQTGPGETSCANNTEAVPGRGRIAGCCSVDSFLLEADLVDSFLPQMDDFKQPPCQGRAFGLGDTGQVNRHRPVLLAPWPGWPGLLRSDQLTGITGRWRWTRAPIRVPGGRIL